MDVPRDVDVIQGPLAEIIRTDYENQVRQCIIDSPVHMSHFSSTMKVRTDELLSLLALKAYRSGEFTLASGRKSNHYVNCKPVSLSGEGLRLISLLLLEHVEDESSAVAGLTLGADPLVSGVAMAAAQRNLKLDALIVRKQAKEHGTSAWLEGPLPPKGSKITVLEDVVTTGGSSLKAVRQLRETGYVVDRVVAIVDRQEGAQEIMETSGLELVSLFLLKQVAERFRELTR